MKFKNKLIKTKEELEIARAAARVNEYKKQADIIRNVIDFKEIV